MTRWDVICTKCSTVAKFRHAGEVCERAHGSPYIIECDCTGVPLANWSEENKPAYWSKNEKLKHIVKRSDIGENSG